MSLTRTTALLHRYALLGVRRATVAPAATEAGLTLIESLVAMLLITITVSLITPPIFMVAATRVQNQRAEQALSLAQGEIDRIKLAMEQGAFDPATTTLPLSAAAANAQAVPAPTAIRTNLAAVTSPTDAYYRDVNGDGENDFFVQVFRTNEEVGASGAILAFQVGVRVYQVRADENLGSLEAEARVSTTTSGLGFQKTAPMSALFTTVARSNSDESFATYRQYTTNNN